MRVSLADNHRPRKEKEDIDRARSARKNPSAAEDIVWELIRNRKLGFNFKREHPFGGYRFDFYCAEAKLALEMDGEQHDPAYDAERDRYAAKFGVLVFRIPNVEFFKVDPVQPYENGIEECINLCEQRTGRPRF